MCVEQEVYEDFIPVEKKRSFSFSLHVGTKEGFSVAGGITMIDEQRPTVMRANRPRPSKPDTYDDRGADAKTPSSALRVRHTEPIAQHKYRFGGVWRSVLWVLLLALVLFFLADTLGITLMQHFQYGNYPTTQLDVNLGHGGESHLTAYTVGNEIILTEQVGNKLTPYAIKSTIQFTSPRIVTIMIADVNLDKKPDVLLHVDGLSQSIIFDNTGTGLVLGLAH